jgi:hypothetical protein
MIETTAYYNEQDGENYELFRGSLRAAVGIADDIVQLYDVNHGALLPHIKTKGQQIAVLMVSGQCSKHLIIGTNNLFRGYAGVMYRETRSAVETAALARNLQRDQKVFEAFMDDREDDDGARYRFRQVTRRNHLFPSAAEPSIQALGRHYDYASTKAHANLTNFLNQILKSETDNTHQIMLQDFSRTDPLSELLSAFLWMCMTHVDILVASREAIFSDIDGDYTEYSIKRDAILGLITSVAEKFSRYLSEKN